MIRQAVMLNLIIIREAASQIETEFAKANPAVPWKKLRGMRNRMTHGYVDTDFELVWETVRLALLALDRVLTEHQTGD
jgi:uncharacterized protein with HEPN domain